MNSDHSSSHGDPPANDPLDRLLQNARWPEPPQEQIDRLWLRWLGRSPRRVGRIWFAVAAAAAVVLALVTGSRLLRWHANTIDLVQTVAPPEETAPTVSTSSARGVESRAATVYEQLVLVAAERRRPTDSSADPHVDEWLPLHTAIDRLVSDPAANVGELADSLVESASDGRARLEWKLTVLVQRETGARQRAAVRLLGHCATSRSLPLLLELTARPPTHSAAVTGVARLADSTTLVRLVAAESDATLKRELLAELVRRGDGDSVSYYLDFVQDPPTAQTALDALDAVPDPPVETLFQMLSGSNYPRRLAAARVLGRLDGPVISQRLARMVVRDVNRREALIALLTSPGQDAIEFLKTAGRHSALAGDVRAARSQLHAIQ